jgi:hypothetical protein
LEVLEDRTLFAASVLSAAAFPAGPQPTSATANGQSEVAPSHSISDNGRFAVFASTANNIVPGQIQNQPTENIFLHDQTTGATTLVSHTAGTDATAVATSANGRSMNAIISGDGSTVLFFSLATDLIAGETFAGSGHTELYLYDVASGSRKLVSHTPTDVAAGGVVTEAANAAHPFVPPTPGGFSQYVNTLGYNTGFPALGIGEGLALPSISANDQYIAYISDATDLGGANTGAGHGVQTNVFLYDRAADTNTLVSHNAMSLTTAANGWASTVAISGDGSTIAFTDPATDLVANLTTPYMNHGGDELYVWSRIDNAATGMAAGQIRLASHAAGSETTLATIPSSIAPLFGFTGDVPPSLSYSGNAVAYYFAGNNLVAGEAGPASVLNVFRYDVLNNANDLVTHVAGNTAMAGDNPPNQVASGGVGPAEATGPVISADGRFIAFANNSSNLLTNPGSTAFTSQYGRDNVYLYDATTFANTLVNHADGLADTPNAKGATAPSMSADGRYVAFVDLAYPSQGQGSTHSLSGPSGGGSVRVYDRLATGSAALAQPPVVGGVFNASTTLQVAAAILAPTVMSADGSMLVWDGDASDVVPNDLNNNLDVFLATTGISTTTLPIIDITLPNTTTTAGRPVGTPIDILTTIDPNPGQTFTYTLLTNTDKFTIVNNQLVTNTTFLNTTPETYQVTIRTTDHPLGLSYEKTFTITVNISTTPPTDISLTTTGTVTAGSPVGTPIGTLTTTDPNVGVTQTYTIVPGTYSDLFTITGDTLQTNASLLPGTYDIQIQTTDTLGLSYTQTISITVYAAPPTDITLTNNTILGAQPLGTLVGFLNTIDQNPGPYIYTILPGPNADRFAVDINGALTTNDVFDVGTLSMYSLSIHSVDSLGLSVDRTFIINVYPSPPTEITLAGNTVLAAQPLSTVIGFLDTIDPNLNQTFTYTLTGPNAGLFAVDSNGVLTTNTVFAVTGPTDYSLGVHSVDSLGLAVDQTFIITVYPAPPTDITLSHNVVASGQPIGTVIGYLDTIDPNLNQTFTYTILPGPNADLFAVDSDGRLTTTTMFDMTNQTEYQVSIRSVDSLGLSVDQTFTITVYPGAITLSNDKVQAARPVGTAIGVLATVDPNPDQTLTYTLTGPYANLFTVDSDGVLRTAIIFEVTSPTVYALGIHAVDGLGFSFDETLTVTVYPALPTDITLSNHTIAAGQPAGTVIGYLTTIDPNLDQTFTYTLTGPNAGLFTVDSNGALTTTTSLDGSQNSYLVGVRSVDTLGLEVEVTLIIVVTA